MRSSLVSKLVVAAAIAACAASVQAGKVKDAGQDDELVPTGKGWGERATPDRQAGRNRPTGNNGISYHGGPLMLGTPNAYYIWYGSWTGNSATTILDDLAKSIGGSSYFAINSTYYDGSNTHVTGNAAFAGERSVGYTHGTALSDTNIEQIVTETISAGLLPKDSNGMYFVLTSSDVTETSGFCTQYCGWHTSSSILGSDIKFAFIGNPDRCPSACEIQTTGPNGNAGADGMASIIAHEFEEAISDPDLNAWYDRRGQENADKCAWTFGSTYKTSNGALANMKLGNRDFMIQQNWVNASGGYCAKSYP